MPKLKTREERQREAIHQERRTFWLVISAAALTYTLVSIAIGYPL